MIKLTDLLTEIGEGTNPYPIVNKDVAINEAKRIYGSMLTDGGNAPNRVVEIKFTTTNNVKYFASYYCIPHDMDDGSGVAARVEIGFSAKDLGQYGSIRKNLTDFITEFGKKFLIRTVDAALLDDGKAAALNAFSVPTYMKRKHRVEQISSAPFIDKVSIFIGDIGSALGMGDSAFELEATYNESPALPKDIQCWKSLDEPGIYFIKTSNSFKAYIDPSNISSPLTKNLIKYLVNNTQFDYKDQVLTGKGDALRVVSTVVSFAKTLGTIIPIDTIVFNPAKRPEEAGIASQETGRGRLYLAFVKKAYPDAQVDYDGLRDDETIEVLLNEPTMDPIVSK